MSRSYRQPYAVDGYGTKAKKISKRTANHKVRQFNDLASGNAYRKVYNPWNICDYKFKVDETWHDHYKYRRK